MLGLEGYGDHALNPSTAQAFIRDCFKAETSERIPSLLTPQRRQVIGSTVIDIICSA